MNHIAEKVQLLDGFPKHGINVYLVADILIDAATRWGKRRILRQIRGQDLRAHALTHAHPDHQGASHAVCDALDILFWVGEGDAHAAETGDLRGTMPRGGFANFSAGLWAGPGHPVDRRLTEGDEVGGFTVIETPGHSPGHVSFWRESDRCLIVGDVVFNMNMFTGRTGLTLPPDLFTVSPEQNRASARRLAELNPAVVAFGHGPVMSDGARFVEFVNGLPE